MAPPPSLEAKGHELRIGCEIETLVSLVTDDSLKSSDIQLPKDSRHAAQLICKGYKDAPGRGQNPIQLHPHFANGLPFNVLLPPHRNGNFWAKTFRNNNRYFKDKNVAGCIRLIEACKTVQSVVDLMHGGETRYFAWNFKNLDADLPGTGKTIEWRQPAAMHTSQGCISWIELVIAFVQAARRPDLDCRRYAGTVEGLKDFAWMGVVVDASDARYMDSIFNEKTGAADLIEATPPPDAELDAKVKEDQRKNLMLMRLSQRIEAEAKAAEKAAEKAAAAKKAAQDAAAAANGGRK
ncbi:hypothetical protein KVR01_000986 [Diaporthe batatas]|uniref:uncharacterized protein n=1 Tax=Diaporthe batatas TaxID=748121 RepID=UPI001D040A40|nr:uncharacterized protein KVR01_000986 [Diaporthe batatas]KAG8170241.1 hypothetical protein KVR01_000986 [Diaporthe batatas]